MSTTTTERIRLQYRGTRRRLWTAAAVAAVLLIALYAVLPAVGIDYPHGRTFLAPLYRPAAAVLGSLEVTSVLLAVTVLTVIAVVRKLHYGIAAVLLTTLGANLMGAAMRAWIGDAVLPSAVANGPVIAAASVVAAASTVCAWRWRPAVAGLGSVVILAVAGAAVITAAASVVSVVGALLVVGFWWSLASVVMTHSPIAAERERQNPLSTAAMALGATRDRD
ncbi:hypothetical protein GCM10007304_13280 [Rhodococcoides trifolii]|uniref:Uncharacterized protein n=1 Tax=Rhodococcoides trifolii TaxID=908250 RepID=A0A917FTM1_9NOCA|nr:hypothetical protein [Rhodococcus trifolii]GGG00678.1 hypothetical protein GCM10007304_13280 [Rhodococcus trifolii]